jgi:hypothetical protein
MSVDTSSEQNLATLVRYLGQHVAAQVRPAILILIAVTQQRFRPHDVGCDQGDKEWL